jgi:hypothetical protein
LPEQGTFPQQRFVLRKKKERISVGKGSAKRTCFSHERAADTGALYFFAGTWYNNESFVTAALRQPGERRLRMTICFKRPEACADARRRLTDGYIFIMLLVFPLFTGFRGYTELTVSKFSLFIVLTAAWLLGLAALSIRSGGRFPRPEPAQWAALALLAFSCLSALCSQYGASCLLGAGRYDGLVSLAGYVLIFLGVSLFGSFRKCHAAAFGVSVTLCCIVAVFQLFGKNPLGLFPGDYCYYDAHIKFTSEFLGTVGNVDLLADVLCPAAALFFALSVIYAVKWSVLALIPLFFSSLILAASGVAGGAVACAAAALIAAPLLLTDMLRLSRAMRACAVCALAVSLAVSISGGYAGDTVKVSLSPGPAAVACLSAGCVLFVLSLALPRLHMRPDGRKMRKFFAILSAASVLLALAVVWLWPGSSGAVYELSQLMRGRAEDSFGSSRLLIWKSVLALVPEHPLLGGGPGTLPLRLDIEFSRFVPETGRTLRSYVDNAHCVCLQTFADLGAVGLLSLLGTVFRSLFLALRRGGDIGKALFLAVSCACVQGLFGLGLCVTAPVFWILLGLAASCARSPA